MKKFLLPVLGIMSIAATGCGGGGSSTSSMPSTSPVVAPILTPVPNVPAPGPGNTTTPSANSTAKFIIKVPAKATKGASIARSTASVHTLGSKRNPLFVGASTQSMTITLTSVNGFAPAGGVATLVQNLTPTSAGCVTQTGTDSGTLCTVSFPTLPVGLDGFKLTTFDAASGTGNALSTNTVSGYIVVGATTNIPVTLAGIIKTLALTLGTDTDTPNANWLTSGVAPATRPVTVTAFDAAQDTIIGSYQFQDALNNNDSINLAVNDTDLLNTITLSGAAAADTLTNFVDPTGYLSSYTYSGVGIADKEDTITVSDTLGLAAPVTKPIRVTAATAATLPTLTITNAPNDFLPQTGFPQGTLPLAPGYDANWIPKAQDVTKGVLNANAVYDVSSGSDSVVDVTDTQLGWGTIAHPFVVTNTCDASVVGANSPSVAVLPGAGGIDTYILKASPSANSGLGSAGILLQSHDRQTLNGSGPGPIATAPPAVTPAIQCNITFTGGAGDSDTVHYALDATANSANFQVQSHARN